MHFRYKDAQGKVVSLPDVTSLAQAIRDGEVNSETPLAAGEEREFKRAELVVAYQQASVAVGNSRRGTPPSPSGAGPRAAETGLRNRKLFWLALIPVAVGTILLWRGRGSSADSGAPEVGLPPLASAPEVAAARDSLVLIFADSFAVLAHRLETWVSEQKFEQRFRGSSLQSGSSLRAARAGTKLYLARVDSLVAGTRALAAPLTALADSLENSGRPLGGLLAATQDALDEWGREVSAYAELTRGLVAAIDALAEFLQSRQQSFVVRDAQPVFLSRDDGLRFRDLKLARDDSEGAVARWAGGVLEKHPRWMSNLDPTSRPAFRRAPP